MRPFTPPSFSVWSRVSAPEPLSPCPLLVVPSVVAPSCRLLTRCLGTRGRHLWGSTFFVCTVLTFREFSLRGKQQSVPRSLPSRGLQSKLIPFPHNSIPQALILHGAADPPLLWADSHPPSGDRTPAPSPQGHLLTKAQEICFSVGVQGGPRSSTASSFGTLTSVKGQGACVGIILCCEFT